MRWPHIAVLVIAAVIAGYALMRRRATPMEPWRHDLVREDEIDLRDPVTSRQTNRIDADADGEGAAVRDGWVSGR